MSAWKRLLPLVVLLLACQASFAIIVPGGRSTNGTLDNSGTNKNPAPNDLSSYTGTFGGFLGTPIAPQYFITATHIGLGISDTFVYNDGGNTPITYNVSVANAMNDLAIWKINGPQVFTHYAPIYLGNNEVGRPSISIGNGTTRGAAVNSPTTTQLAGWEWGNGSTLRSWGTNTINAIVNPGIGVPFGGDFLYFSFSNQVAGNGNTLTPDVGIFSGGDSGGPTFVQDVDNVWKLAGINSLVEQVSQTPNGAGYAAGLFDARGFYDGNTLIDDPNAVPLSSLATRISSRQDFVIFVTAIPEPSTFVLIALLGVPGLYWVARRQPVHASKTEALAAE